MAHVDVVIVGAGPVGAMLAVELRLRGVEVLVLERLAEPTGQSRASALHARTVATLRRRGLLEPFAEIAQRDGAGFAPPRGRAQFAGMAVLDRSVLPVDGPHCSASPRPGSSLSSVDVLSDWARGFCVGAT